MGGVFDSVVEGILWFFLFEIFGVELFHSKIKYKNVNNYKYLMRNKNVIKKSTRNFNHFILQLL
jgi:hypothetical protein